MLWDRFKHLAPCWPGFGGRVLACNFDDLPLSVSGSFAMSLSLRTHLVVPFFCALLMHAEADSQHHWQPL